MILTPGEIEEVIALKRECLETLYNSTVNVYALEQNESGLILRGKEVEILHEEPCRISHQTSHASSDNPKEINKRINVMLAPEHNIEAGTRFEITTNGVTKVFKQASEPKKYSDHQTVELKEYHEGQKFFT